MLRQNSNLVGGVLRQQICGGQTRHTGAVTSVSRGSKCGPVELELENLGGKIIPQNHNVVSHNGQFDLEVLRKSRHK